MYINVVIPTMNEPAVDQVIGEILDVLTDHEVQILVIDKSSDDTPKRARKAGAKVFRQQGSGYGDAYLQGFKEINKDADVVIMLDGDYTYDPKDIPKLLEPISNDSADIVIGNRFKNMEKEAMSFRNRLGNRFITYFVKFLYNIPINDSQSGFRAIKVDSLNQLDLRHTGMPFATEMLIESQKKGLKTKEVPISYRKRIGEEKLRPYKDAFSILITSIRLVRDYNPLKIFLPLGIFTGLIGVIIGLTVVHQWLIQGSIVYLARSILSALLILFGLQILLFGFIADLLVELARK